MYLKSRALENHRNGGYQIFLKASMLVELKTGLFENYMWKSRIPGLLPVLHAALSPL